MKLVKTYDGSYTFFSEKFNETYHSKSGAIEEAFKKFIEPCKIKKGMKILDICFGLGYNSLAAIHIADNLKIIALENDRKILNRLQELEVPNDLKKDFEKIKEVAKNLEYIDKDVELKILLGDARETIKEINQKFDAVFLDPFSPKKCMALWQLDFFKEIKKRMMPNAILATYSCARIVRDNLKKAGFKIIDGPRVGRRSPSTIAKL